MIAFFDDDSNILKAVEIENLGDNSFQELALNVMDVARMEINLAGSGALTGFDFILPSADSTFNTTTSVEPF